MKQVQLIILKKSPLKSAGGIKNGSTNNCSAKESGCMGDRVKWGTYDYGAQRLHVIMGEKGHLFTKINTGLF